MKFRYALALLVAVFAISNVSKAQTVVFEGGGSTAMFLEVGQAAAAYENSITAGSACIWTSNTVASGADIAALDHRPSVYGLAADAQLGKIWVVYGKGAGTCAAPVAPYNIYSYMSVDSVEGDRCFFEVDTSDNLNGCIQTMTPTAAEAALQGTNYLANAACPGDPYCDSAALPAAVSGALNGHHWNVIGTDVRPEDAKFASYRMFTPCGQSVYRQPFDQGLRITYGLGYQTTNAGVGVSIDEDLASHTKSTVLDFNISGNDPINAGHAVPAYTTTTIGAQPMIVAVSPAGAGTVWANASDINMFTLTLFYQGVLGRTQDIPGGATGASNQPVTTWVREPLSGTYNTFEYSAPNTSQFHGSQDDNNCDGAGHVFANPMRLASANGTFIGPAADGSLGNGFAYRRRATGTGHVVAQLQAASPTDARLGYFFWSAANGSKFTATNGKYLTVNGVDPLLDNYATNPAGTPGIIPVGAANLASVTFKGMQAGDYPIWSALRLVTAPAPPAGLANVLSGLNTINPTQHDFVAPSNMTVWHSHFYLQAIGNTSGANGNVALNVPSVGTGTGICPAGGALAEIGGDAGGANLYTQANYDFCSDFSNITGLINKAN